MICTISNLILSKAWTSSITIFPSDVVIIHSQPINSLRVHLGKSGVDNVIFSRSIQYWQIPSIFINKISTFMFFRKLEEMSKLRKGIIHKNTVYLYMINTSLIDKGLKSFLGKRSAFKCDEHLIARHRNFSLNVSSCHICN